MVVVLLAQAAGIPHVYDEIRRLRAQQPVPYKALGFAYYLARQHLLFRQMMEQAIANDPRDFEPHYALARHYDADLGDHDRAARLFEEALARNARHARSHAGLARVLEVVARGEGALASYRRALDLEPCLAAAHLGLARLGEEPRRHVERALECDPKDASAHRLAAKLASGRKVIEHLREALRLEPTDLATVYQLHRAYAAVGDQGAALEALDEYRRLQAIYGSN